MGYYASGGGYLMLADNKTLPSDVEECIYEAFGYMHKSNNIIEIIFDHDKYHEDEVYSAIDSCSPYISEGEIEFTGEDDVHWKIAFNGISWDEYYGRIVYDKEPARSLADILNRKE